MGGIEALDVEFELEGTHVRVEVERVGRGAVEPLGQVLVVGDGGAESDDANVALDLRAYVAHARANDLEDGAVLAAEQVELVDYEQVHVLHLFALFPAARQNVPVDRSADYDVAFADELQVCGCFAR